MSEEKQADRQMSTPFVIERKDEIDASIQAYGMPIFETVALEKSHFMTNHIRKRTAEVCMVVHRPNAKLITVRQARYPVGVVRLPTGGIEHGEPILTALLRETREETGLTVNVTRFLCVVSYTVATIPIFTSFAFLVQEVSGVLGPLDPLEQIAEYREVTIDDLPTIATALENLQSTYPGADNWGEWAAFRAPLHRMVRLALQAS